MNARYLVRFDDICPAMDWEKWAPVDVILQEKNIKPIIAVVPDNRDESLIAGPERPDFWCYIRTRQAMGWSIAMHGLHHQYETQYPGLMGINNYSEFSGLPYEVQREKIGKSLKIFQSEGVRIDAWVAPGHNFDAITVKVLLEYGIEIISDGFYWRPVKKLGATWIPQQMWRFRKLPIGTWTVCFHPNQFTPSTLRKFNGDIRKFALSIVSLQEILNDCKSHPISWMDRTFATFWRIFLLKKTFSNAVFPLNDTSAKT